jgi:Leucine-rich repeat (LRR) protein
LVISNAQFQEFPLSITTLSQLTYLDLYGNKLNNFPDCLDRFQALTEPELGCNESQDLPPSMDKLHPLAFCIPITMN